LIHCLSIAHSFLLLDERGRLNKELGSRILKEVKPEDLPDLKFKFEDK
jgi:hypothetical protein